MAIRNYFVFIIFVIGTISAYFMNDDERQKFYQDILISHNGYRFWHYAGVLKLDQEISNMLKEHTDKLDANKKSKISSQYGINSITLEFIEEPILIANGIVSLWYSYGQDYNYLVEPLTPSKEIDQFTQIVWQDTTNIGVRLWIKNNTCTIIVAYLPKGNIKGQYLTKISPPRKKIKQND